MAKGADHLQPRSSLPASSCSRRIHPQAHTSPTSKLHDAEEDSAVRGHFLSSIKTHEFFRVRHTSCVHNRDRPSFHQRQSRFPVPTPLPCPEYDNHRIALLDVERVQSRNTPPIVRKKREHGWLYISNRLYFKTHSHMVIMFKHAPWLGNLASLYCCSQLVTRLQSVNHRIR